MGGNSLKKTKSGRKPRVSCKVKISSEPKFTLPPHSYRNVISTLSQSQGWQIQQLNVPDAWKVTEGEGETIFQIDTGQPNHIDLNDNILSDKCRSFVPGEDVSDKEGHSSHTAGLMVAENNGIGIVGISPRAKIITVKSLDDSGMGDFDWIVSALKYAISIRQYISVISMSLGSPVGTDELHDVIKTLYSLDVPLIAAVGNDGPSGSVNYPAAYPEVISCGAIDKNGNIADFSSRGPRVDFVEPGEDLYSTFLNNQYCIMSGSSMSTPILASIVALLIAKHKKQEAEIGQNDCKTVEQIRQHLIKYADDKGALGRDSSYGYGVVSAGKLILNNDSTLNTTLSSTISSIPTPIFGKPSKGVLRKIWEYLRNIFHINN